MLIKVYPLSLEIILSSIKLFIVFALSYDSFWRTYILFLAYYFLRNYFGNLFLLGMFIYLYLHRVTF